MKYIPFYVIVSLLICSSVQGESAIGFFVLSPTELKRELIAGPVAFPSFKFDVTANATFITDRDLCDKDRLNAIGAQLEGKIVLYDQSDIVNRCRTRPSDVAIELLPYNIAGLVLKETHGVGYSQVLEPTVNTDIPIPTVTIIGIEFDNLVAEYNKMVANIDSSDNTFIIRIRTPDYNAWKRLVNGPVGIVIQTIMIIYLIVTLSIGSYKLHQYVRVQGFELSITKVCLLLDIISTLIRMLFIVDPLGFYGIWSIETSAIIFTFSTPFSLCSVLLIAFYWNNLIKSFGSYSKANKWLQERKKPYMICVSITYSILLVLSFADLANPGQGIESLLIVVVLAIFSLIIGIFFIVNGFSILKFLYTTTGRIKRKSAVTTITWFIGSLGISMIAVVISLGILGGDPNYRYTNVGILSAQFSLFFFSFTVSFLVVLAFQAPGEMDGSGTPSTQYSSRSKQSGEASASIPSYNSSSANVNDVNDDDNDNNNDNSNSNSIPMNESKLSDENNNNNNIELHQQVESV